MAEAPREVVRQLASAAAAEVKVTGRQGEALLGHFLGVLYALDRAFGLDYRDRTGSAKPREYSSELTRVARRLARGRRPDDCQWLAGFYLNSALYRLAALAERAAKHLDQDRRLAKDISDEVNRLKHEVEGLLSARVVGSERTLAAARRVLRALQRNCHKWRCLGVGTTSRAA